MLWLISLWRISYLVAYKLSICQSIYLLLFFASNATDCYIVVLQCRLHAAAGVWHVLLCRVSAAFWYTQW